MPRQGLDRQAVVQAALRLIEEKGYAAFSMGELAKSLHVRPASLYNHIENLESLYTEVGLAAISQMVAEEEKAIQNQTGDAAMFALAHAYRDFARTHYELYKVIMSFQRSKNHVLEIAAGRIVEPIFKAFSAYSLSRDQEIHWQRILRSMMHGFIAHEQNGGFSHFPADRDETYQIGIQCIIDGLKTAGKDTHEN